MAETATGAIKATSPDRGHAAQGRRPSGYHSGRSRTSTSIGWPG